MAVCQIQYSSFLLSLDRGMGTLRTLDVHGDLLRQQSDVCVAPHMSSLVGRV